jgi:hypothetical protein
LPVRSGGTREKGQQLLDCVPPLGGIFEKRMAQLYLHDREIKTAFDLLGSDENDITYSLGWGLSKNSFSISQWMSTGRKNHQIILAFDTMASCGQFITWRVTRL